VVLDSIAVFGDTAGMRYPGGKSGAGVYQRIISQMPPHNVYIEPFLGGGSVMRYKLPARYNLGIDLDDEVVQRAAALAKAGEWVPPRARTGGNCGLLSSGAAPLFEFLQGDGIDWLRRQASLNSAMVYADPPYLVETRSCQRRMYRCELGAVDHRQLLAVLASLKCYVLLSGYPSELYDLALSTWRVVRYRTMTRAGRMADECLWCNFPEPVELHDYRYLGTDYRDRERLKRKRLRWERRLSAMPVLERQALLAALQNVSADTVGDTGADVGADPNE